MTPTRARIVLCAAVLLGCATPLWDAEQLEARHPVLRRHPGHRLAEIRPYYLPLRGQLTLLLCRWPRDVPIGVEIASDASVAERRSVLLALKALEDARLGVRFDVTEHLAGPGIRIEFVDGMLSWASSTLAECAVRDSGSATTGRAIDAQLVSAWVELGRNDPRLVGSALHELGHALGFQGHPRRGDSVMRRDASLLLDTHLRVGRGEAFRDATLSALYALPSGTVLARLPLSQEQTRPVDRLVALGRPRGWRGPLLQVGDEAGRIDWLEPDRGRVAVRLSGLRSALDDPSRLVIEPLESARAWLE